MARLSTKPCPEFTPTALTMPNNLMCVEWHALGDELLGAWIPNPWHLGDLLAYGQRRFDGLCGDRLTTRQRSCLEGFARVAERFDVDRRRESLTYGHHAAVTAMSDPMQAYWLDRAECQEWAVGELRAAINRSNSLDGMAK